MHDETGKLCATGYVMSQQDLLGDQEFVFGRHKTWQVPIASIERKARLAFGRLATVDPLADVDEAVATPLTGFQQITFRRR
jgi:endonuclease G